MSRAQNPYAKANWQTREAARRLDAAREPVIAFYTVPRALLEAVLAAGGSWLALASEADAAGHTCVIRRARKRDMKDTVAAGFAIVYELDGGVGVFQQGW